MADSLFTYTGQSYIDSPPKSTESCVVCGDSATGIHYGALACEGCKGFFRRCLTKGMRQQCTNNESCEMNRTARNSCQYCRLKKCLEAGMSRQASKLGRRPKQQSKFYVSHSNDRKQLSPTDVWKFLWEEEQNKNERRFGHVFRVNKTDDRPSQPQSDNHQTVDNLNYKALYLGKPTTLNVSSLAYLPQPDHLYDGEMNIVHHQLMSDFHAASRTNGVTSSSTGVSPIPLSDTASTFSNNSSELIHHSQLSTAAAFVTHNTNSSSRTTLCTEEQLAAIQPVFLLSEHSINAEIHRLNTALESGAQVQKYAPHYYQPPPAGWPGPLHAIAETDSIYGEETENMSVSTGVVANDQHNIPHSEMINESFKPVPPPSGNAAQRSPTTSSSTPSTSTTIGGVTLRNPSLYSGSSKSATTFNRYSMISSSSTSTRGQYSLSADEKEALIDSLARLVIDPRAPASEPSEHYATMVNHVRETVAQAHLDTLFNCFEQVQHSPTSQQSNTLPAEVDNKRSSLISVGETQSDSTSCSVAAVSLSQESSNSAESHTENAFASPKPKSSRKSVFSRIAQAPRKLLNNRKSIEPSKPPVAISSPPKPETDFDSSASSIYPKLPAFSDTPLIIPLHISPPKANDDDSMDPEAVWNESFIPSMMPVMLRIVDFCKRIPGFNELPLDDQVSLIKQGAFEIIALRAMRIIDPVNETMLEVRMQESATPPRRMSRNFVSRLPLMGSLLDGFFPFAQEFKPLNLSQREIGLLAAVVIVCADRAVGGPESKQAVMRLQALILQALQMEITVSRSAATGFEADQLIKRIIQLVPHLRKLNNWHAKKMDHLRRKHPEEMEKFPKLYTEIFDKNFAKAKILP